MASEKATVDIKNKLKITIPSVVIVPEYDSFVIKSPTSVTSEISKDITFTGEIYFEKDKMKIIELMTPLYYITDRDWRFIDWTHFYSNVIKFIADNDHNILIKVIMISQEIILSKTHSFRKKLISSYLINSILVTKPELISFNHVENILLSVLLMDVKIKPNKIIKSDEIIEDDEIINFGIIEYDMKFIFVQILCSDIKVRMETITKINYLMKKRYKESRYDKFICDQYFKRTYDCKYDTISIDDIWCAIDNINAVFSI
jgi:hypothetical protein